MVIKFSIYSFNNHFYSCINYSFYMELMIKKTKRKLNNKQQRQKIRNGKEKKERRNMMKEAREDNEYVKKNLNTN